MYDKAVNGAELDAQLRISEGGAPGGRPMKRSPDLKMFVSKNKEEAGAMDV